MQQRTLYEVSEELARLNAILEEIGGDLSKLGEHEAEFTKHMEDILTDEGVKLEWYLNNIKQLEMEAAAAEAEEEQWAAKKRSRRNSAVYYRRKILECLIRAGQKEAISARGRKVRIVTNGGDPPVLYDDNATEKMTNEERILYVTEVPVVATSLVKKDLKDGKQLTFARLGERGIHLGIY